MITVTVSGFAGSLPLHGRELSRLLEGMLVRAGFEPARSRLELNCVTDRTMTSLNRAFLRAPGPTNILSFPDDVDRVNGSLSGSLVLSVHCLAREARLYGQEPETHCRRLLAHGLAHLLGLDHGPDMDALCALMLDENLSGLSDGAGFFADQKACATEA